MYRPQEEISEIHRFFNNHDWNWISRDERKWWREFCFHYTDLPNVPEILTKGYLCSRKLLEQNNANWLDVASQQVLERTSEEVKNSVRFYFRPKTPTQYQIEGIKSKDTLNDSKYHQHCRMPVFLLFDIIETLSRRDSQFSDGNLASRRSKKFIQPKDLWNLPWKGIYHNSYLDPLQKSEITRQRCAEIIIPEKIDLNGLKYIYCRSEAEKETLLSILQENPEVFAKYQKLITSSGKYDLYEKRHTFIEKVNPLEDKIIISFSPETQSPGPFEITVIFTNKYSRKIKTKTIMDASGLVSIHLPEFMQGEYQFQLFLDEYLVYQNTFRTNLNYLDDIIF